MRELFFDRSMLQNLFSELFGILVTIIIIDTLYEYRRQKEENEHMKGILEGVRRIYSDATTFAFGPAGGQAFLEITQITAPKHAHMLAAIIGLLDDYNREVENFVDRYSVLATRQFVVELRNIIGSIDDKLHDIAIVYGWQIQNGPLNEDDSVPKAPGKHNFENMLRATHLVPLDRQSIANQYKKLRSEYESMDNLINRLTNKEISFFRVLKNDSLLSGIIPSKRETNPISIFRSSDP